MDGQIKLKEGGRSGIEDAKTLRLGDSKVRPGTVKTLGVLESSSL
jgi:hypothetical protein